MNESVRGKFSLIDGVITPVKALSELKPPKGSQIYEVLRIQEATPLFLNDHLLRLQFSAARTGEKITQKEIESIKSGLNKLIKANAFVIGNIKVLVSFERHQSQVVMFFLPHQYPSEETYARGVKLGLFHAVRSLPNAKIANTSVRDEVNRYLQETGYFEVLLVDDEQCITEGSRSNVFFLLDEKTLVTAPDELILPGITRKYVIDIIKQSCFVLELRKLQVNELGGIQGAFITGTSPKVMPVQQIGSHIYPVGHSSVKEIMEVYEQCIQADIDAHRS
ncbi:MAG: aminotransferase class IV [Bacteroidota bacterium]